LGPTISAITEEWAIPNIITNAFKKLYLFQDNKLKIMDLGFLQFELPQIDRQFCLKIMFLAITEGIFFKICTQKKP